jgi:hypothetical protein
VARCGCSKTAEHYGCGMKVFTNPCVSFTKGGEPYELVVTDVTKKFVLGICWFLSSRKMFVR